MAHFWSILEAASPFNLQQGEEVVEAQIEFSENLWSRLVKSAERRGYASPQKYVADVIEREVAKDDTFSDAEIAQKMEDLGYLDHGRDI